MNSFNIAINRKTIISDVLNLVYNNKVQLKKYDIALNKLNDLQFNNFIISLKLKCDECYINGIYYIIDIKNNQMFISSY